MIEGSRVRISIVGVVALALFSALFARLWFLQVASGQSYAAAAQSNRVRLVQTEGPRGRILDRQGRPLADNEVTDVITVDRTIPAKQRTEIVGRLAELLSLPKEEIQQKLDDPRISPYKPVPIQTDAPEAAVVYIREHKEDFPGVDAQPVAVRQYPEKNVAAHLLGFVGEINDDELKARKDTNYELGDTIGKAGVERTYEFDLRGKPGVEKFEIDSQGRALRSLGSKTPAQGNDVRLTIDLDVQKVAEESLQLGIDTARKRFDKDTRKRFQAPAGSVVVLDARDGSVVAMASNPSYDPNDFVTGIPTATWNFLNDPKSDFPLTDRSLQGQYAPGSTFKLFSALAGLRNGVISTGTTITDTGSTKIAGTTFKNAGGAQYGRINLPRALTVSSDVYFYNLGYLFWRMQYRHDPKGDGIQNLAREFGFGRPSGVALPGEPPGRVPDEQFKKDFNANNPDPKSKAENSVWLPGDNVNLAVGQGDTLVTPLQLASAYATFANGGAVYIPRLAWRVQGADGTVKRDIAPQVYGQISIDPGQHAAIMSALRGVVSDKKGTANPAFTGFPLSKVSVAGKTGTAEVTGKQDTSLFVAITPVEQPQYVVLSVVEEAGRGAEVSAPIVRRVIEGLNNLALSGVDAATGTTGN